MTNHGAVLSGEEPHVTIQITKLATGKATYQVKVPVAVVEGKTTEECAEEAYQICLEYWNKLEEIFAGSGVEIKL